MPRSGCETLGARVEEVDFDLSAGRPSFLALRGEWFVNWMYSRLDQQHRLGANVANNVKAGLAGTVRELAGAEVVRGQLWHRFREFFERYDHLITPCVAVPPFPVEQNYPDSIAGKPMQTYMDWIAPTFVLSLTGLPVGAVPCGRDAGGMPVGMQIVGRQFGRGVGAGARARRGDGDGGLRSWNFSHEVLMSRKTLMACAAVAFIAQAAFAQNPTPRRARRPLPRRWRVRRCQPVASRIAR